MNVLIQIGIDFLRNNLLPKLKVSQVVFSLLSKLLDMIQELFFVLTDSDQNNAAQVKSVWQKHYVELLAIVLSGATMALKNDNTKTQIIGILKETLNKLEPNAETI